MCWQLERGGPWSDSGVYVCACLRVFCVLGSVYVCVSWAVFLCSWAMCVHDMCVCVCVQGLYVCLCV